MSWGRWGGVVGQVSWCNGGRWVGVIGEVGWCRRPYGAVTAVVSAGPMDTATRAHRISGRLREILDRINMEGSQRSLRVGMRGSGEERGDSEYVMLYSEIGGGH